MIARILTAPVTSVVVRRGVTLLHSHSASNPSESAVTGLKLELQNVSLTALVCKLRRSVGLSDNGCTSFSTPTVPAIPQRVQGLDVKVANAGL